MASVHERGAMQAASQSILTPESAVVGSYSHGAYPHPDRQGLCTYADLQSHSLQSWHCSQCNGVCCPEAGIDLNLAAQQLQAPPGLLLSTSTHLGSGHKRQRTDDDADPSGTVLPKQSFAHVTVLPGVDECWPLQRPVLVFQLSPTVDLAVPTCISSTTLLHVGDSPHPGGNGSERKAKGPYFEFAKKKWETEDTFRYCIVQALQLKRSTPAHMHVCSTTQLLMRVCFNMHL